MGKPPILAQRVGVWVPHLGVLRQMPGLSRADPTETADEVAVIAEATSFVDLTPRLVRAPCDSPEPRSGSDGDDHRPGTVATAAVASDEQAAATGSQGGGSQGIERGYVARLHSHRIDTEK